MSTSFMNDVVLGPTMCYQSPIVSTIPPLPHFFSQPNRAFAQKSKSQSSPPKLLRRHTQPAIPSVEFGTATENNDQSIPKPSIHQILLNQGPGHYTLDNFAVFLQTQFCSENLAFWLASRQYKLCALSLCQSIQPAIPDFDLRLESSNLLNATQSRRFVDLQREMFGLIESFIRPGSPYELNLSDVVRRRLLKTAEEQGDFHPRVLNQAREAILDLMKSTSYPLFLELSEQQAAALASPSTSRSRSDSGSALSDCGSFEGCKALQGRVTRPKWHTKVISKVLKRP
ncbi:hypothetical protein BGZ52_012697 [Haplosporangium bisporale]|nr:hypothetical protein BGZ52_012697 [Haplosporangium bisporale]KAF9217874.1 hypothetical protein BGZ59_008982 [Podila verticillata]KAI9234334.1 MAG: RGS domain-containing protein [Podila humilis]KFH68536.1 hypothetical protein MVEG_05350 [Podila verticillata NRRL 6337]